MTKYSAVLASLALILSVSAAAADGPSRTNGGLERVSEGGQLTRQPRGDGYYIITFSD